MTFYFFSLASGVEVGSYVVVVSSRISDGVTNFAPSTLEHISDVRREISDRLVFHDLKDETLEMEGGEQPAILFVPTLYHFDQGDELPVVLFVRFPPYRYMLMWVCCY